MSSPRPRGPEREAGAFGHGVGPPSPRSPGLAEAESSARRSETCPPRAARFSLSLSLSLSLSPSLSLSLSLSLFFPQGMRGLLNPPATWPPNCYLSLSLSLSFFFAKGMSGVLSPPATRAPHVLRGFERA